MKKPYEKAELELMIFEEKDIITMSLGDSGDDFFGED